MASLNEKGGIRVDGNNVTFWLRMKPRSSREHFALDSSGEPRLELHAAPADGQANGACIKFFARLLRVPGSSIEIVTGEKSRRKLIRIRGGEELAMKLRSALG